MGKTRWRLVLPYVKEKSSEAILALLPHTLFPEPLGSLSRRCLSTRDQGAECSVAISSPKPARFRSAETERSWTLGQSITGSTVLSFRF